VKPLQITLVCRQALGRARFDRVTIDGPELHAKRGDDRARDFVLHGEDVGHLTVERVRPEVEARGGVDELRCHPEPSADVAHTTAQHRGDVKSSSDFADVTARAAKRERARTRRNLEPFQLRQRVDQLLAQSITQVIVLGVAAHVDERQHGNRRVQDRHRHVKTVETEARRQPPRRRRSRWPVSST